jgi:uncharacterized protein (TIGR02757 family)
MPRLTAHEKRCKSRLDALLPHYHHAGFIQDDPMRFAAPFRFDLPRCEANALLSALLSYGRRETILQKLTELFDRLEEPVWDLLQAESIAPAQRRLKGFVYRFNTGRDIALLLEWWHRFYQRYPSHLAVLQALVETRPISSSAEVYPLLERWLQEWLPPDFLEGGHYAYGTRYLLPHPATGGACKRLHMALRWLCRDDSTMGGGAVDFGLWKHVIPPRYLCMPMDTHVGRLSREWGLLKRKSTDAKAALELTAALARFAPEDPVRYDFSFLGFGVDEVRNRNPENLILSL